MSAEAAESSTNFQSGDARIREFMGNELNRPFIEPINEIESEINKFKEKSVLLKLGRPKKDAEGKLVKGDVKNAKGVVSVGQLYEPISDAERATLTTEVKNWEASSRKKDLEDSLKEYRSSRIAMRSHALDVVLSSSDVLVSDLLTHSFNNVLAAGGKITMPEHLLANVEKLASYPLIRNLPTLSRVVLEHQQAAEEKATKEAAEKVAKAAAKAASKAAETTTAVAKAATPAVVAAAAPEEKKPELSHEFMTHVSNWGSHLIATSKDGSGKFMYRELPPSKVAKAKAPTDGVAPAEPAADVAKADAAPAHTSLRLSKTLSHLVAQLLQEYVTRLANNVRVCLDGIRSKTWTPEIVMSVLRMMVSDGVTPVEAISRNSVTKEITVKGVKTSKTNVYWERSSTFERSVVDDVKSRFAARSEVRNKKQEARKAALAAKKEAAPAVVATPVVAATPTPAGKLTVNTPAKPAAAPAATAPAKAAATTAKPAAKK